MFEDIGTIAQKCVISNRMNGIGTTNAQKRDQAEKRWCGIEPTAKENARRQPFSSQYSFSVMTFQMEDLSADPARMHFTASNAVAMLWSMLL